jgi:hypothetical protein
LPPLTLTIGVLDVLGDDAFRDAGPAPSGCGGEGVGDGAEHDSLPLLNPVRVAGSRSRLRDCKVPGLGGRPVVGVDVVSVHHQGVVQRQVHLVDAARVPNDLSADDAIVFGLREGRAYQGMSTAVPPPRSARSPSQDLAPRPDRSGVGESSADGGADKKSCVGHAAIGSIDVARGLPQQEQPAKSGCRDRAQHVRGRPPTVAPVTHPIRHLVPLDNENGWSDLLAALIETDPAPVADALALGPVQPGDVQVRRETASGADPTGRRRDRIDLLVDVQGTLRAALEVKVLSDLGRAQLERYRESYPGADRYVLVAPAQFPLPEQDNPGWEQQSWESLIGALATSEQPWVAATAHAWLEHLSSALPQLTARTRWDDLHVGDPFPLMLRARIAWVHQHLQAQEGLTTRLVQATGSNKWVTRVHADSVAAGYRVVAEVEDATPVRSKRHFPKVMSETTPPPTGPEFRVFLEQVGVNTSAGFSWAYLHAMWPLMEDARSDWWTASGPKPPEPHDRAGRAAIVAAGAPRHLGFGFGEKQTRSSRSCMFGAKLRLPASSTLQQVAETLDGLGALVLAMAATPMPEDDHGLYSTVEPDPSA